MKIKISTLKKITAVGFITLFAAFLVLPNTGLPRSKENAAIVARENRKITPRPTQSLKSKEFYTQFENWYQDRLRYRDKAIKRWSEINSKIGVIVNNKFNKLFRSKNNWYFHKDMIIKNFAEPEQKAESLKVLQNYCQSKGKHFILFIPPSKETMYREFFPNDIQAFYQKPNAFLEQGEKIFQEKGINFLTITKDLENEKASHPQFLYIPADSHWNYYGASFAADKILQKISDESDVKFYTGLNLDDTFIEKTYPSDYLNMLGLEPNHEKGKMPWSKNYTDEIYATDCYTGETKKVGAMLANIDYWKTIHNGEVVLKNEKIESDLKLLILSDSYTTFMAPYFAQFAKETVITHYNGYADKKTKTDMEYLFNKYNPDVVVLEIVDRIFYPASNQGLFGKFSY